MDYIRATVVVVEVVVVVVVVVAAAVVILVVVEIDLRFKKGSKNKAQARSDLRTSHHNSRVRELWGRFDEPFSTCTFFLSSFSVRIIPTTTTTTTTITVCKVCGFFIACEKC